MNNIYSINKIILIGHIQKDGRHHLRSNEPQPTVHFSMATEDTIMKNGLEVSSEEYHDVKVPGKIAGTGTLFLKGRMIYLEGSIKTRSFMDESGIKRYRTEIWVNHYKFLT